MLATWGTTPLNRVQDVLARQLADVHSAEIQMVAVLPRMAAAAHAPALRVLFEDHLRETHVHLRRLELLRLFVEWPSSPSHAMRWLVEEAEEIVDAEGGPAALDAALIGAARRLEHYEIAAYGVACSLAKALGRKRVASLLGETIDEEARADSLLASLADGIVDSGREGEAA